MTGNRSRIGLLLALVALAWGIEIIDLVLGGALDRFGIRPRRIDGLPGIALAPLLHGGIGHLISNTLPFLILGWLVAHQGLRRFAAVTVIVILVGGLGTWSFGGAGTVHVGASGVIFGYFGFLLLNGWFERSFRAILIAVGVTLFYGGMIWGVLPGQRGISWEGHLFGFIGGILAARALASKSLARA